ncbi:MAG: hypothetical protein OHK93_004707 [Ramalina farinacea]|uniref:Uncharacterized protein n=1 Tax=Ramalina farinacea TaxID=258253 RepID=A0AA43QWD9_9LECA|nr:hypothetical protein [Ramalina farinacea]
MSAMEIDVATAQNIQTLGSISHDRKRLEAEALAWASQKGEQYRDEAMTFIQNEQAVLERRAAQWKADEQTGLENRALVWKANEEELFKSNLEARLAELEQRAKSEHAERMAQERAEHARVIKDERARTTTAIRINQLRSDQIIKMKVEEERLRGVIKTHEDAAKSQQQGADKQSTQVQSLTKSLAKKDLELEKKSKSNTKLQQQLASSKTEVVSARLWGTRKNVEIAGLELDKSTLILQGRSSIAAKDTRINDLQDRLKKTEAENEKLGRIAKDKQDQIDKLKMEGSKTEDKLAAVVSQKPKSRSRMSKVRKHFAKCKFSDGAADLADAIGDFQIATSPSSGSKRQAAGGVKLGRTTKGRVGKAQPGASIRLRRRQGQGTVATAKAWRKATAESMTDARASPSCLPLLLQPNSSRELWPFATSQASSSLAPLLEVNSIVSAGSSYPFLGRRLPILDLLSSCNTISVHGYLSTTSKPRRSTPHRSSGGMIHLHLLVISTSNLVKTGTLDSPQILSRQDLSNSVKTETFKPPHIMSRHDRSFSSRHTYF